MARRRSQNERRESSGGLLALYPLGLVFAAMTFLAFGANRAGVEQTKTARPAAAAPQQDAAEAAATEKAAAAAVVAISLARVAPALPEAALDPPKTEPQPGVAQVRQNPAPRNGTAGQGKPPQQQRTAAGSPGPIGGASGEQQAPAARKPVAEDESVLARIGSYAPSPRRIANAVTDSVTKLASYIPGL
jgi:hypothetical protein